MVNSKTLLGFVTGMATGVLLGILFAPDKGSKSRQKIASTTGDLSDAVKDSFSDFVDGLKDIYSSRKATKNDPEKAMDN